MKALDPDELRIAREAVMWRMRLQSEGRACHAHFKAWLMESSRHLKAYLLAVTIAPRLKALDPLLDIDVDALISEVKDRVVPLTLERHDNTDGAVKPARTRPRRPTVWATAAAAVVVVVAGGFFMFVAPITLGAETYSTAVGEQRKVKLKDGSLVHLNTNSQVNVRYSASGRDVELLKGEALFTVERDIKRPFRVSAGTTVVNAVGTEFDVYRQPARTVIEVVKGEVSVQSPEPDLYLKSGDTASVDLSGRVRKSAPNVQLAQNWQQRRLVFNGESLTEVAAEFNRYNQDQIVVEGKELGARPVGGIYSADHPETLVDFLKRDDARIVVDTSSAKNIITIRLRDNS
ncbi:MAG: FecR domain-containing protein [Proteobacteria bacterium]|nr:FecR domain-containing protein [Pseudomonadota bacterium]